MKKSLPVVTFLSSVTCLVASIITFSKLRGPRSVFWSFPIYIQKCKFILSIEGYDSAKLIIFRALLPIEWVSFHFHEKYWGVAAGLLERIHPSRIFTHVYIDTHEI